MEKPPQYLDIGAFSDLRNQIRLPEEIYEAPLEHDPDYEPYESFDEYIPSPDETNKSVAVVTQRPLFYCLLFVLENICLFGWPIGLNLQIPTFILRWAP